LDIIVKIKIIETLAMKTHWLLGLMRYKKESSLLYLWGYIDKTIKFYGTITESINGDIIIDDDDVLSYVKLNECTSIKK